MFFYLKDSKVGKCAEGLTRVSLWKGRMTYVKQIILSLFLSINQSDFDHSA